MGEDLVTSSELKSENPREVFQSKLLTLLVSMNEDSSLLGEISTVLLFLRKQRKQSPRFIFFGESLYDRISKERRGSPSYQRFYLLIYMFCIMGSLPPLEILQLIKYTYACATMLH